MKRFLTIAATASLLAGCTSMSTQAPGTAANPNEMKIAFDVTTGNPQALIKTLETIDLTRRQLIDRGVTPHIVVTFRGDASFYTQTNASLIAKEADRAEAPKIASKIKELRAASGVDSIEQCNIPLGPRKIASHDLMPEVKLVPNGWIALVGYQQKGYAYIAP
jgi:intracellular sulfur oxidation DsrE/DsrF family protein